MSRSPSRGAKACGTSSSRGNDASDPKLVAVYTRALKFLGEYIDLPPSYECELCVKLYKECVMNRGFDCSVYLSLRPEGCPDFNKDFDAPLKIVCKCGMIAVRPENYLEWDCIDGGGFSVDK